MSQRAKAVYAYAAESERELTFNVGDEIEILKSDPSGWSQGALPNGTKGWFPSAYVEEIVYSLDDAPPSRAPPPVAQPSAVAHQPAVPIPASTSNLSSTVSKGAPRGRALPAPPGKGKPAAAVHEDGVKAGSAPERTFSPVRTAPAPGSSPTGVATIAASADRTVSPVQSSVPVISPRFLGLPGTASMDTRRAQTPTRTEAEDGHPHQQHHAPLSALIGGGGGKPPPVPARRGASAVTPVAAQQASAAAAAYNAQNPHFVRPLSPVTHTRPLSPLGGSHGHSTSGVVPPVPRRSRAGSVPGAEEHAAATAPVATATPTAPSLAISMPIKLDAAAAAMATSPVTTISPRGLSPRASPRSLSPRTKPVLDQTAANNTTVAQATATSPALVTPASTERLAKLLYKQEPQAESELSADAGEIVRVQLSDNDDWWYVQTILEPLREGYVPRSYLEMLPLPAPRPGSSIGVSAEKKASVSGAASGGGGASGKTPEERLAHRQKAAREVVETEQAYVRNLDIVHRLYLTPLRKDPGLCSKADVEIIFSNLEDLRTINREVLNALEKQLENDAIGKAFNHLVKFLQLYTTYCKNYQNSISKLQDKEKDSRFAAFLSKQKAESGTQLDLPSLLIMPVQRIPRYKLLFDELLKYTDDTHPDYKDLCSCLEHINKIAGGVNESMRQADQQAKLAALYKSFIGSCPPLVQRGRVLIREGPLLKVCRKDRKERYFFLFNDMLLYGLKLATGQYTCHQAVTLECVSVVDLPDAPEVQNAFLLRSNAKSFVVISESPVEKSAWLKAFNDNLPKGEGKPHAPLWTPDSDAAACRICSAEFTFLKRRHHCRNCGAVVCGNCSQKEFKLAFSGRSERVCDRCYDTLYSEWKASLQTKS